MGPTKLVLAVVAAVIVAVVAAIGPTTLVLAVVVVAALLDFSQTRAVPRVNPYGSNHMAKSHSMSRHAARECSRGRAIKNGD